MWNIVLVGAGGAGMSAVAGILWDLGFSNLVCINNENNQLTDALSAMWANVVIGHGTYEVTRDDAVIYSAAAINSVEVQTAKQFEHDGKSAVIVWNYFEFLWELSKYFSTVGVSGTNGKSSTTAIWLSVAKDLMPDFGIGIVGALVSDLGNKNYVINASAKEDIKTILSSIFSKKPLQDHSILKKYVFMLESCEYKRHFLHLDVDYVLIISLSCDHLDYFKDEADYAHAFVEYFDRCKYGVFVLEREQKYLQANLSPEDYSRVSKKFVLVKNEHIQFDHLFGKWHEWNASLLLHYFVQIAALSAHDVLEKMRGFTGLWRRMESLWTLPWGALLYSDYGHMAESLDLGYDALREKFPNKRILALFQPHQLRRVVIWWEDFLLALKRYDEVVVYDIYAAREKIEDYQDFAWFEDLDELSVESIGHHFAKKSWGVYMDNFDTLWSKLVTFGEDTVVVLYTAGDLDYHLRSQLWFD